MSKKFVIRKIAYHYSDDHWFFHTIGGIQGIFDSEEIARKEFLRLEREALESVDLGDTAQLSGCDNTYLKEALEFKSYYRSTFGEDIVRQGAHGMLSCERGTYLPKGLRDEELLKVRKMLDLKFYELYAFENEPVFYGVWIKKQGKFMEWFNAPYFYNTYAEALDNAHQSMSNTLSRSSFKGSLEELSESPVLLSSLVNTSNQIEYDVDQKELRTKFLQKGDAIALHELLKEKAFEIREIPLAEVQRIDPEIYERV